MSHRSLENSCADPRPRRARSGQGAGRYPWEIAKPLYQNSAPALHPIWILPPKRGTDQAADYTPPAGTSPIGHSVSFASNSLQVRQLETPRRPTAPTPSFASNGVMSARSVSAATTTPASPATSSMSAISNSLRLCFTLLRQLQPPGPPYRTPSGSASPLLRQQQAQCPPDRATITRPSPATASRSASSRLPPAPLRRPSPAATSRPAISNSLRLRFTLLRQQQPPGPPDRDPSQADRAAPFRSPARELLRTRIRNRCAQPAVCYVGELAGLTPVIIRPGAEGKALAASSTESSRVASSDDVFKAQGTVVATLRNATFKVKLDSGHEVVARASGKMRRGRLIRIIPGDRVELEVSTYDPTRGRIVWRYR